jgi:hypothetical protein
MAQYEEEKSKLYELKETFFIFAFATTSSMISFLLLGSLSP